MITRKQSIYLIAKGVGEAMKSVFSGTVGGA